MSHFANVLLNSPGIYARITRKKDSSMIQRNYVDKLSLLGMPGSVRSRSKADEDRPRSSEISP